MPRPKKTIESEIQESIEKTVENTTIQPYYVRVLDNNIIRTIDVTKEPNWQLKYKHPTGTNFHY
jgi:hypothetical protein